jgi:two-component system nitrate/nitrite response regulator NarL
VKVHLKAILRKIHVSNRTQAAIWAMSHCLEASNAVPVVAAANGSAMQADSGSSSRH